jgi:flagellar basal-body rod protein FlgG
MQQVLSIALTGMQEDMNHLDRVAQNMVNLATPGYKREVVAARPFVDVLQDAAAAEAPGGAPAAVVTRPLVLIDKHAGSLRATGNAFDVALAGDGFLEVSTPSGPAYTRQGNLAIDDHGRLVSAGGDPVMGKGGEIRLVTRTPVIDAAGNISEPDAPAGSGVPTDGSPVAQLKVVRFEDTRPMRHIGAGLMSAGTGPALASDIEARVHQGQLENSNTNTMQEMVQVMQTMRHFESMQKVAQGYDDLLGIAINKLGDLS